MNWSRFASRKFISLLAVQIIALVALVAPAKTDKVDPVVTDTSALVVSVLSALGYIKAETGLDHKSLDLQKGDDGTTGGSQ